MGRLNVDDLRPGMRLVEDITGWDGRRLVEAGTILQKRHLRILKAWGVSEAAIEGFDRVAVEQQHDAALPPGLLQSVRERVSRHMAHSSDSALERELYRLTVLRLSMKIVRKRIPPPRDIDVEALRASTARDLYEKKAEAIYAVVDGQIQLFSFPAIYTRVVEALESPVASASKLAEVVSSDVSLTARLLRLVNSPFYGFPSKIDSVARAIALIGDKELVTLVLGISVMDVFAGASAGNFSMTSFWQHSVRCAILARVLAGHVGLLEEPLFVGGLLHDLGMVLMAAQHPQTMHAAQLYAYEYKVPLYSAEQAIFGFDHSGAGGLLLSRWNFPERLVRTVGYHHIPSKKYAPPEAAVVHLADILAHLRHIEDLPDGVMVPPLDAAALESKLNLAPSTIATVMAQAERQFASVAAALL